MLVCYEKKIPLIFVQRQQLYSVVYLCDFFKVRFNNEMINSLMKLWHYIYTIVRKFTVSVNLSNLEVQLTFVKYVKSLF